jgi:hypothetical protein
MIVNKDGQLMTVNEGTVKKVNDFPFALQLRSIKKKVLHKSRIYSVFNGKFPNIPNIEISSQKSVNVMFYRVVMKF